LTTTFTSGSCSLNLTTSITVDFLNPSDINHPIPNKLPARINPMFPPNCRNLVIDYTCVDEFNEPKNMSDLEPFTDYNCAVPEDIPRVTVYVPERNVITVKCKAPSSFNGPVNQYIARLRYGSDTLHESNGTKCHFEFRDLSHSTTYKLELTAFNGYFESRPWTADVSTLYDEISIIRYLVSFIYVATSVGVILYINKIYGKRKESKNDVNEAVMLETFSVYENPRVSESENTP
ncbi:hypothetical protein Q5P01_000514, partial [Channa striata]